MRKLRYDIIQQFEGVTVQNYLMQQHGFSRRIIIKLKNSFGDILLNGYHIRMIDKIKTGDIIEITLQEDTYIQPNADLFAEIVYEDSDVIVYNKPINMPVHPSRNHKTDTLANLFCHHMNERGIKTTFRPINRLDRDTSGLCVVAKNSLSASKLSGKVNKEYTAIACGKVSPLKATIDAPIFRPDDFHIKRCIDERGQKAITHYEVIEQSEKYSLVKVLLETGRTHQIRVHFSHIGYPLAGDTMYGGITQDIKRQALCCSSVWFIHPNTNKQVNLCINIQEDMQISIHSE